MKRLKYHHFFSKHYLQRQFYCQTTYQWCAIINPVSSSFSSKSCRFLFVIGLCGKFDYTSSTQLDPLNSYLFIIMQLNRLWHFRTGTQGFFSQKMLYMVFPESTSYTCRAGARRSQGGDRLTITDRKMQRKR